MLHMADRSGAFRDNSCLEVLRHVTVLKMILYFICAVLVSSWKKALWGSVQLIEYKPTKHQPNHFVFSSDYWTNRWLPFTMLKVLSERLKFSVFWVGSNIKQIPISLSFSCQEQSSCHVRLKTKVLAMTPFCKNAFSFVQLTRAHLSFISTAVLQNVKNCSSRLFSLHQHWNPLLCLKLPQKCWKSFFTF